MNAAEMRRSGSQSVAASMPRSPRALRTLRIWLGPRHGRADPLLRRPGLIQGEGWLFRGLDLYIGQRDRLALIGRNGAGKTTLLKCLAGMIDTGRGQAHDRSGHACRAARAGPDDGRLRHARGMGAARPGRARARMRPRRSPTSSASICRGRRRPPVAASGGARQSPGRWRKSPTCCCSTSRPTISTSARSSGSRTGSSASKARSSSSATTAPS